jgi:hypothetical protein
MNQLGRDARELVELCRDSDDPSDDDRQRVRRRIAAAAGLGTATLATQVAKGATLAGSAVAGKTAVATVTTGKVATLLFGGLAAGVIASSAAALTWPPPSKDSGREERRSEAAVVAPELEERRPASSRAPVQDPTGEQSLAITPVAEAKAARSVRPERSTLAEETRLLERARAALAAGDPAGALGLATEHTRTYPRGALAEEAAVTRILALCRLGRTLEASGATARFLALSPKSPLRGRVEASCGGSSLSVTDRRAPGHSGVEGDGKP